MTQRPSQVGGGAAYLDFITDGITGKILAIEIELNEAGHVTVANDLTTVIDADLEAGHHTIPVLALDQWLPGELGTTVAMSVRWQAS